MLWCPEQVVGYDPERITKLQDTVAGNRFHEVPRILILKLCFENTLPSIRYIADLKSALAGEDEAQGCRICMSSLRSVDCRLANFWSLAIEYPTKVTRPLFELVN